MVQSHPMKRRRFLKTWFAGAGAMFTARDVCSLKYFPRPSDKKWAVLYSTWCGTARDAAVWISEGMGGIADVFDVRENPDPTAFDHVIVGGAIRNMAVSQGLQDYIASNKGQLSKKTRALFAVCGNMRRPVGPEQTTALIDDHLARLCEVSDVPSRVFLGRITKSLMDPETARMMAAMEDYDNLKRADCMAFGREILTSAE